MKKVLMLAFALATLSMAASVTGTVVAVSGRYLVLNVSGVLTTVVLPKQMVMYTNVTQVLQPGTTITVNGTITPIGVVQAQAIVLNNTVYNGTKVYKVMRPMMGKRMGNMTMGAMGGNMTRAMNRMRIMNQTQTMNQTRAMVMNRVRAGQGMNVTNATAPMGPMTPMNTVTQPMMPRPANPVSPMPGAPSATTPKTPGAGMGGGMGGHGRRG